MADSASVSSFSSLDNVSRSSMLRRQREAALRRHQNSEAPLRNDRLRAPSSLSTTLADVVNETRAVEEAKSRDRIEARVLEEDRRREEARKQLELKRKLAEEQAAREKERLAAEEARNAELELKRRLAEELEEREKALEAERAKFEAERQQHAQMLGQYQGAGDASLKRTDTHPSSGSDYDEEAYGQVSRDMAGGNNGYQRYLSTFHQPIEDADGQARGETKEDATIISELTDGYSPRGSVQAERNACIPTSNNADGKGSKMKRSMSTRSLSFNELNEADESGEQRSPAVRSSPTGDGVSEESSSSRDDASKPMASKKQIVTIDSANFDDPNVMRSFLMQPCPKGEGMVQCCVRRNKGIKNALFPEYRIYLKNSRCTETFLMTSKKRVGNKTSNYLISMSRNDHDKKSDSILGKLRSNFLGTEYMIYDHGNNPDYEESYYDEAGDIRCELGAILYAANTSLGSKGPRKMKVCIPKADDGNPANVWQPTEKDDERMITSFKKETDNIDKLECLENKPPSWNEEVGAYVLNFNGRVTQASVKNFQLCKKADSEQEQIMQFGRTGKDEFSLDVSWPMSLFQAFAVALSSFDSKLGCD